MRGNSVRKKRCPCRTEALHAASLRAGRDWNWQNWPAHWRDPQSSAVREFASENEREFLFHSFLQWIADRSLAVAQQKITQAGMRIGFLADFAVGTNPAGSSAWSKQKDVLVGLQIGAPPDLFNTSGQNWGLTTFSPRALATGGFAPFVAALRACLRHAGGVRIDHAMGLMRLWVVPRGAEASEGDYLSYPLEDLLRLIALKSRRQKAIVIGEDLGTVPAGFRERLAAAGIYGMSVLWFERKRTAFVPPRSWPTNVAAMTSTHDLPTVAGWWRGRDLEVRKEFGFISDVTGERESRSKDRGTLWRSFRAAKVASGEAPRRSKARQLPMPPSNFSPARDPIWHCCRSKTLLRCWNSPICPVPSTNSRIGDAAIVAPPPSCLTIRASKED